MNIKVGSFDMGVFPLDFESSHEIAPARPQHNASEAQDQCQQRNNAHHESACFPRQQFVMEVIN